MDDNDESGNLSALKNNLQYKLYKYNNKYKHKGAFVSTARIYEQRQYWRRSQRSNFIKVILAFLWAPKAHQNIKNKKKNLTTKASKFIWLHKWGMKCKTYMKCKHINTLSKLIRDSRGPSEPRGRRGGKRGSWCCAEVIWVAKECDLARSSPDTARGTETLPNLCKGGSSAEIVAAGSPNGSRACWLLVRSACCEMGRRALSDSTDILGMCSAEATFSLGMSIFGEMSCAAVASAPFLTFNKRVRCSRRRWLTCSIILMCESKASMEMAGCDVTRVRRSSKSWSADFSST